jgi:uncharacterized cupin superfamily protein
VLDTGFTVFYGNHEHAFGPGSDVGFSAPLTNGDQSLSQADGDVAFLVVGSCRTVAIVVYHPDDNLGPLLR